MIILFAGSSIICKLSSPISFYWLRWSKGYSDQICSGRSAVRHCFLDMAWPLHPWTPHSCSLQESYTRWGQVTFLHRWGLTWAWGATGSELLGKASSVFSGVVTGKLPVLWRYTHAWLMWAILNTVHTKQTWKKKQNCKNNKKIGRRHVGKKGFTENWKWMREGDRQVKSGQNAYARLKTGTYSYIVELSSGFRYLNLYVYWHALQNIYC